MNDKIDVMVSKAKELLKADTVDCTMEAASLLDKAVNELKSSFTNEDSNIH